MSLKTKDSSPKMSQLPLIDSNLSRDYIQIVAELGLLSRELTMSVDILGKIRDSVQGLEQSLEVPQ